jgi:1-acyl-sn-glycerol-3-phosphate acyltransferase
LGFAQPRAMDSVDGRIETSPEVAEPTAELDRPDLFTEAKARLGLLERANIRFVRWSTTFGPMHRLCGWFQRKPGAAWVHHGSRHIRAVKGLERLPDLNELDSFVVVANHRSYFDLFVISMLLFRAGLQRRMLFPVRSAFFYDNPIGFLVNGVMSFWSMYPPFFRERRRATLNRTSLSELIWTLNNTKSAVGLHPEGRRDQGDDPYKLLKAQAGVGRVILESRAPAIPVFINGLSNSFMGQLKRNFRGSEEHMTIVFGEPIDFGELLELPNEYKNHRLVSQFALDKVAELAQEEKILRAQLEAGERPQGVVLG